jgi:hypothetical protein
MSRREIHAEGIEMLPWWGWNPGLDNGYRVLGEVLSSMPQVEASSIPWQIRLLENPSSWLSLPGAITLARHDAIHVLLGRGLRAQDEAFVIGFTMGATKALRRWHEALFAMAARRFYPPPYNFSDSDVLSLRLGFGAGAASPATRLERFPFEDHMHRTVNEVRDMVGINLADLHAYYRKERLLNPASKETSRLDLDIGGVDPSDIARPAGAPSDWQKEK